MTPGKNLLGLITKLLRVSILIASCYYVTASAQSEPQATAFTSEGWIIPIQVSMNLKAYLKEYTEWWKHLEACGSLHGSSFTFPPSFLVTLTSAEQKVVLSYESRELIYYTYYWVTEHMTDDSDLISRNNVSSERFKRLRPLRPMPLIFYALEDSNSIVILFLSNGDILMPGLAKKEVDVDKMMCLRLASAEFLSYRSHRQEGVSSVYQYQNAIDEGSGITLWSLSGAGNCEALSAAIDEEARREQRSAFNNRHFDRTDPSSEFGTLARFLGEPDVDCTLVKSSYSDLPSVETSPLSDALEWISQSESLVVLEFGLDDGATQLLIMRGVDGQSGE